MISTSFHPYPETFNPCWHCTSFVAMIYQGSAACCSRPGVSRVCALPERGCSAFEREPGADDEPDRIPVALELPQSTIRAGGYRQAQQMKPPSD